MTGPKLCNQLHRDCRRPFDDGRAAVKGVKQIAGDPYHACPDLPTAFRTHIEMAIVVLANGNANTRIHEHVAQPRIMMLSELIFCMSIWTSAALSAM